MITPDKMVELIFNRLDKTEGKIDEKFKELTPKIDDLCTRMTKLETEKTLTSKRHRAYITAVGIVFGGISCFAAIIATLPYFSSIH